MELVLKIPRGKIPFIGLLVEKSYLSSSETEYFNANQKYIHRLVIEVYKKGLQVKLICDDSLEVKDYYNVKCNAVTLKKWLYITKQSKTMLYNFGLIYQELDKHQVIRVYPKNTPYVLKIDKIEILALDKESLGLMDELPY